MPTSTTLSTLNINKLTRAQYDAAVQGGVIGHTDISIITDEGFEAVPQYSTMPTASADNVGEVVQYIGASDATYTHNYFYECIEDSGTYSWNQTNVQPDYNTNDYTALLNKPSINNVVLTGNKTTSDLGILEDIVQGSNITIDKTDPLNPVISATGQVNSDWNSNSGLSQILNKPSLATVATSGNYSDLSGTPTIPTVNNPTITITQGGVTKGSFTLNQASGDTIALDAGGGGGSVSIDNVTITENLSQEIQAVGTVNANSSNVSAPNVFDWVGTLTQYTSQNIASTHPDWVCYITDDEAPSATLDPHRVVTFQEPTSQNNYTWYRLYADGWVEQGGIISSLNISNSDVHWQATLPVEMTDGNYTFSIGVNGGFAAYTTIQCENNNSTTIQGYARTDISAHGGNKNVSWQLSGMAASI